MLEQTTLQTGLQLGREWGPLWVCVVLGLLYILINEWRNRKNGGKQYKADVEYLKKKISDFKVEFEKHPTWDEFNKEKSEFVRKDVADAKFTAISQRLDHIEELLVEINRKIK